MNIKAPTIATISIVISACGLSFAQGPINNAMQFQEKAVKSALKGSKGQNLGARRDSVMWVNDSYVQDANGTDADDKIPPINIQTQEEVPAK